MSGSDQSVAVPQPARPVADVVPIANETRERVVRAAIIGVPLAAIASAGWLAWGGSLHWQDLLGLRQQGLCGGMVRRSVCQQRHAQHPRAGRTECAGPSAREFRQLQRFSALTSSTVRPERVAPLASAARAFPL